MDVGNLSRLALLCGAISLSAGITACGGSYSGDSGGADSASGDQGGGNTGSQVSTLEEHFTQNVKPNLDDCRTCHKSGGTADVEDGRQFMLNADGSGDLENVRSAWENMGGNLPSRLLTMPSGQESHTGGALWPEGSQPYVAMQTTLKCFDDPDNCSEFLAGSGGGDEVDRRPLLGSMHGGHKWFDFCEDKPDSAELPADPRSLVKPGVSEGKAVHFNAYWVNCHKYPERVNEKPQPQTCGDLRSWTEQGEQLMTSGNVESGHFFAGNDPHARLLTFEAEQYNQVWKRWGLNERPENFDQLVAERYGMPMLDERNPYPLPGEDPNETDGGSGQLPGFLTQLREEDGSWTGRLGFTCHACHSGAAGESENYEDLGFLYGSGNSLQDIALMSRELGVEAKSPGIIFSLFATNRGTNNASDVNLFFLLNQQNGIRLDRHTLGVITSGSTASMDTPAWWNLGHRPQKFVDGYFAGDSSRVDLIFYTPVNGVLGGEEGEKWVSENAQNADKWMMSLESPEYPLEVNEDLAKQGAILFHNKNLWAEGLDNPVPEPEGNGSCASCHGAYSPRFVHDSSFLESPSMEGIAGYVVPKEIIGTDPARVDTNNESVAEFGSTSYLGYPETVGTDADCGPQTREEVRGDRKPGYLAPPLYGIWATAPYFHNGSVPNVWGVLDPEERPDIWKRVSEPKPEGASRKVVMGFDTNLQRAYDEDRLGWDYTALECGDKGTIPFTNCKPNGGTPAVQKILELLYGNLIVAWNLGNVTNLFQVTPQQIENRKIYNTHLFSQGNQGHTFTEVLTDQERRAIIEYLKTL